MTGKIEASRTRRFWQPEIEIGMMQRILSGCITDVKVARFNVLEASISSTAHINYTLSLLEVGIVSREIH